MYSGTSKTLEYKLVSLNTVSFLFSRVLPTSVCGIIVRRESRDTGAITFIIIVWVSNNLIVTDRSSNFLPLITLRPLMSTGTRNTKGGKDSTLRGTFYCILNLFPTIIQPTIIKPAWDGYSVLTIEKRLRRTSIITCLVPTYVKEKWYGLILETLHFVAHWYRYCRLFFTVPVCCCSHW